MIKITVIALSKLKEKYLKDACEEYKKRLSRYCNLQIIELEPERIYDNASKEIINDALDKEALKILKAIPDENRVVSLCIEGKEFSSENFSSEIFNNLHIYKGITFIIGSSYGLSYIIKNKSNLKLSVSPMTFPNQLFRVILLEQIYRAFKISEGGEYHK